MNNRNRVLERFLPAFVEHGIENTSISKLCDYGRINPNTVYQIFESKEEIVISCAQYVTDKMVYELRKGLNQHTGSSQELGEFFFAVFKKYKNEIRFCMQVMTSPNERYNFARNSSEDMIRTWSDEVADVLGYEREWFECKFRLFLSVMYHYCMTDDEKSAEKQCRFIYSIEPNN